MPLSQRHFFVIFLVRNVNIFFQRWPPPFSPIVSWTPKEGPSAGLHRGVRTAPKVAPENDLHFFPKITSLFLKKWSPFFLQNDIAKGPPFFSQMTSFFFRNDAILSATSASHFDLRIPIGQSVLEQFRAPCPLPSLSNTPPQLNRLFGASRCLHWFPK